MTPPKEFFSEVSDDKPAPREWWIIPADKMIDDMQPDPFSSAFDVSVHVIEHSAYTAVCARLEEVLSYLPKVPTQPYERELARKVEELTKERDALRAELTIPFMQAYKDHFKSLLADRALLAEAEAALADVYEHDDGGPTMERIGDLLAKLRKKGGGK